MATGEHGGSNFVGVKLYEEDTPAGGNQLMDHRDRVQDAVAHFEKSAESGSAAGCYNLGVAYFEGRGKEKNAEEAIRLWKKAVAGGNAKAAYSLACIYATNKQDTVQSKRYLAMAASWGHQLAKKALRSIHEDDAQQVPPNELLGKRLVVGDLGAGIVTEFRKGKVMGVGPSQHTLRFDSGTTKTLVLRRHGNGGIRFVLEEDVVDEGKRPMPMPSATTRRTPTAEEGSQRKGVDRLPTNIGDGNL
jgi:hypothetical protein